MIKKVQNPSNSVDPWVMAGGCVAARSRGFLACGFFYPEDGGGTFLRNIDPLNIYTAPHHILQEIDCFM
jgi:hypothetical protein